MPPPSGYSPSICSPIATGPVAFDRTLLQSDREVASIRLGGEIDVDCLFDLARASDALEIVDLSPREPPVQALLSLAQRECAA